MAKSIRISDSLYEMAAANADLMHRSLAQQVEYWACLGHAMESQSSQNQVISALIKQSHLVNDQRVASGELSAESLFFIPRERAKKMKVAWSPASLQDFVL
jgi:hypothetical protein